MNLKYNEQLIWYNIKNKNNKKSLELLSIINIRDLKIIILFIQFDLDLVDPRY